MPLATSFTTFRGKLKVLICYLNAKHNSQRVTNSISKAKSFRELKLSEKKSNATTNVDD